MWETHRRVSSFHTKSAVVDSLPKRTTAPRTVICYSVPREATSLLKETCEKGCWKAARAGGLTASLQQRKRCERVAVAMAHGSEVAHSPESSRCRKSRCCESASSQLVE